MGDSGRGAWALEGEAVVGRGGAASEGWVLEEGESFYRIPDYDRLPPFFMSLVSADDHWFFISSSGGLTAGRGDPDKALFPYYTEDRVTENAGNTGPVTLLRIEREGRTRLWEPLSERGGGRFTVSRNLYKSARGQALIFEEINHELALVFRYTWRTSAAHGFVRSASLRELSGLPCRVDMVDGLRNLLPAGVAAPTQLALSRLLDAYKRGELDPDTDLGIFSFSSLLTDRAEPSEALRATTVWSLGLDGAEFHLSTDYLETFLRGEEAGEGVVMGRLAGSATLVGGVLGEGAEATAASAAGTGAGAEVRGWRCAFLAHLVFELGPRAIRSWRLVAEVDSEGAKVADLAANLETARGEGGAELELVLQAELDEAGRALDAIVARADGLSSMGRSALAVHHYANVLFNVMRGGLFASGYELGRGDLVDFLGLRNKKVVARNAAFLSALPERLRVDELVALAAASGDASLERLCGEYLPLHFGRRHGDPSRPWNRFSIALRDEEGRPRLDYQGNWRDLFQNWEALAWSYPAYVGSMIAVFLDATTADGYNPYRLMREGLEWESPDPDNPWSNIGYWSDHQVIYLLKLLEISERFMPGELDGLLDRRIRSQANLPYRIRPYERLVADPFTSISYDRGVESEIGESVGEIGADGKLLLERGGEVFHVSTAEKLLVILAAKLANFVPEGGIWMNTQRPEWNDANNALAGKGLSVVTTAYLLRYADFLKALFERQGGASLELSRETRELLFGMEAVLSSFRPRLESGFDDTSRRGLVDALGGLASGWREGLYASPPSGIFEAYSADKAAGLATLARVFIEATLRANRRPDGLYHAYNLLRLEEGRAGIDRLDLMLEGQVAILSSGLLSPSEALELLRALRASALYRSDQDTYLLYPDRDLPRFLDKGLVEAGRVAASPLLSALLEAGDGRVLRRDGRGRFRFASQLRNARDLAGVLDLLTKEPRYATLVEAERNSLVDLYETIFGHRDFTGRSGSFFAYEGLGSIYWHMVSKLLLAALETYQAAERAGASPGILAGLEEAYLSIRGGLGFNKTAAVYGAFPTDPYSHSPAGRGAQQPGMTGMVKEEILSRLGELGLEVEGGSLRFSRGLLPREELLSAPARFVCIAVDGREEVIEVEKEGVAFTFCQVPILRSEGEEAGIEIVYRDGKRRRIPGLELDAETSASIFGRRGEVARLELSLGPRGD